MPLIFRWKIIFIVSYQTMKFNDAAGTELATACAVPSILLHHIGELKGLDCDGLPATLVADIERNLMQKKSR